MNIEYKDIADYLPIVGAFASFIAFLIAYSLLRKQTKHKAIKFETTTTLGGKFISNKDVGSCETHESISRLINFAQSVSPDFIVGVNRGGMFVGAYVSLWLGIKSQNFTRCLVSRKGTYRAHCTNVKNLYGNVLVIDDMSWSGKTMQAAINEIKLKSNVKNIYSAVLVASIDTSENTRFKGLDFASYFTKENEIYLPWSPRIKEKLKLEKTKIKLFEESYRKPIDVLVLELIRSLKQSMNQKGRFAAEN